MLEVKLGQGPWFLHPCNSPHLQLPISREVTVLCGWYLLTRTSRALTNVFFEGLGLLAGEVDHCKKNEEIRENSILPFLCQEPPPTLHFRNSRNIGNPQRSCLQILIESQGHWQVLLEAPRMYNIQSCPAPSNYLKSAHNDILKFISKLYKEKHIITIIFHFEKDLL